MRRDAQAAMRVMTEELGLRIGMTELLRAAALLNTDWGPAMTFDPSERQT